MSKYHVLLVSSTSREDESAQALSLLRNRKVEGIIHLASRVHDKLIDTLVEEQFPFVVIGRVPNKQVPCVNNDNVAAARMAVDHLLDGGFSRIAFIGGSPDLVVTCDRLEGYHQAMMARGIPVRSEWVSCSESTIEAGAEVTERLLAHSPRPEAIFAMDDTIAAGALKTATKLGCRIPDDLAVVGFNDDPVSSFVEPALTTVRIPIFEMGHQAARMLIEMIHSGKAPANVVVPAELVVRQSSRRRSEGSSRVDKEGLSWEERSAL